MTVDKIGQDEWVAQVERRHKRPEGWRGTLLRRWDTIGAGWKLIALVVLSALVPVLTHDDYTIRIAGDVCLFGLLALGLNVVVGYAGLLDLGYVAFYGLGAYTYSFLSSPQFGLHWPSWASIPFAICLTAVFGLLLGSPSLRLQGDYLAIVTLGFGQIFVQLTTSMDRVTLPGSTQELNLTGGPNGVVGLDPIHVLGFKFVSVTDYYYLLLAALVVVTLVIYHIYHSRLGRAWRAVGEDALAAEVMGIPVKRLKLLAFALGAAIAGLAGTIFAAWQTAVFPANFDTTLLITLYAMIVLGGLGSLQGAISGAFLLAVLPELLRDIEVSRLLFYGGTLVALVLLIRPRWRAGLVLIALALGGLALKAALAGLSPGAFATLPGNATSAFGRLVESWLVIPQDYTTIGNVAFVVSVFLLLAVSRLRGWARLVLLVPILYLLIFAWETRLAQEPSITRLIVLGASLVVLMNYRPYGLFGQRRVEVV